VCLYYAAHEASGLVVILDLRISRFPKHPVLCQCQKAIDVTSRLFLEERSTNDAVDEVSKRVYTAYHLSFPYLAPNFHLPFVGIAASALLPDLETSLSKI
jgi:hypothetical protein